MIDRYRSRELAHLLSRPTQIALYLQVLAAVANAQGHTETGSVISQLDLQPADWETYESQFRHETAAFVELVRDQLPPEHQPYVYIGLTSSNLQDTAEALLWNDLVRRVLAIKLYALSTSWLMLIGGRRTARTHGRDTGLAVETYAIYQRAARDLRECLATLKTAPLRAALGGPVGDYSPFLNRSQASIAARALDLELDQYATQTADRHRLMTVVNCLAQIAGVLEQVATYQRLASISGVDQYVEHHADDRQMGSSSMPHKRNPITSEKVCGLARVVRGHQSALMETCYTQWWERDLTNSSVERTAWRDTIVLVDHLLDCALSIDVLSSWVADADLPDPAESSFYQYNRAILYGAYPRQTYQDLKG